MRKTVRIAITAAITLGVPVIIYYIGWVLREWLGDPYGVVRNYEQAALEVWGQTLITGFLTTLVILGVVFLAATAASIVYEITDSRG